MFSCIISEKKKSNGGDKLSMIKPVLSKETESDHFTEIYETYFDMIYRICYVYFKGNKYDTEDAVSETFIRFLKNFSPTENKEHEKAGLIVTAQNVCKNMLKKPHRKHISINEMSPETFVGNVTLKSDMMEFLLKLPENQKTALYLYYYEGYSGEEIAGLMNVKRNTVFSYLDRGRKKLKKLLEKEGQS